MDSLTVYAIAQTLAIVGLLYSHNARTTFLAKTISELADLVQKSRNKIDELERRIDELSRGRFN